MPHALHPKAKPPNKPKRPAHRPTKFTPELGEQIGALIASGWSMKHVARYFHISPETVCRWAIKHEGFREVYALAREIAADAMAEAKALDLIGVAEKLAQPKIIELPR
jgi:Bacteriophage Sf6, terminase small subunit-like